MTIRYELIENDKIAGKGRFLARVCSYDTYKMEQVIDHMLQHHSTVSRADILAVLEEFFTTVENLLLHGINVDTPLAKASALQNANYPSWIYTKRILIVTDLVALPVSVVTTLVVTGYCK